MSILSDMIDEMCQEIDEFEKHDLIPGTPLYTLQQTLISATKSYRESKAKRLNRCEISGIEWNDKREVIGVNP